AEQPDPRHRISTSWCVKLWLDPVSSAAPLFARMKKARHFAGLLSSGGRIWTHFPDRLAYRFIEVRPLCRDARVAASNPPAPFSLRLRCLSGLWIRACHFRHGRSLLDRKELPLARNPF